MAEYVKCPKCKGTGEYHDETMDAGKEKLVTCDMCKGQQEVAGTPNTNEFIFEALVHMGNAAHQMAWANTAVGGIDVVPEEVKVAMKGVYQEIYNLQERLRVIRNEGAQQES